MSKPFHVDDFQNNSLTEWLGREFIYLNEVNSTNSYLKRLRADQFSHGAVVLTDNQTAGRGQYERGWISDPFKNLTFTIALKPEVNLSLTLLTLGCASAISDVLQRYCHDPIRIKWPNDIFVADMKIGGILTESVFMGSRIERVLIGIGINLDQTEIKQLNSYTSCSLAELSQTEFTRENLLSECLQEIESMYEHWLQSNPAMIRSIHSRLIGYGEWVKLKVYDELLPDTYKCIGVNEKGELLMLNEQLDVDKFSYEQVRIVPIKSTLQKV